ncbi:cation-transporting P-type ATPase [Aliiglaciecola litoralis]|uniref:Cation-transporting P-type ATPase N-terminal domain-containing protein n=1 Tax=Aliiglaciecola litoralis TaxID=582857 RepID=A0ABP3X0U9_9ALTE
MFDSPCYQLDQQQILKRLITSKAGLSAVEVKRRLADYGANDIPTKSQRSLLVITLAQFSDFMILILLFAAMVSGLLDELTDTIAIIVIVAFNAIIGATQDFRAQKEIASLKALYSPRVQVTRDAKRLVCSPIELVPGDIVNLEAGDIVA